MTNSRRSGGAKPEADAQASAPQGIPSSRPRAGPQLVSDNSGHAQQLSRIVEHEIIPRLLLMHSNATAVARRSGVLIGASHVSALAELAVTDDPSGASRFVESLKDAGATPHQLLLELLSPCAALMGSWWCSDVFDFVDVTIGMCRLQQALQSHVSAHRPAPPLDAPDILFAVPPQAQHTFGAAVAVECFSLAGWDARLAAPADWPALKTALSDEFVDVLALSLSTDGQVQDVASVIVELRSASRNRHLCILVGGPAALVEPDLAARCGADGMALTAGAAVELAQRWVHDGRRTRAVTDSS